MKPKEQKERERQSLFDIEDPLDAEHLSSPEALSRLEWLSDRILQQRSGYAAELYLATLSAVLSKHHDGKYPEFTEQLLRSLLGFLQDAVKDLGPNKSGLTTRRRKLINAVRWATVLAVEELGFTTGDACEIAGRLLIAENHFAAPGEQGPKNTSSSVRKTIRQSYTDIHSKLFKDWKTGTSVGMLIESVLAVPTVSLPKIRSLQTGLKPVHKSGRKPLPPPPKDWPLHPEDQNHGPK